jgi:hypothetical protein
MLSRKSLVVAVGATLTAAGLAFAPAAHAERIGFNLSIGGPGYAVSVGNAPYYGGPRYYGPRHYYPRHYYAPAYVPAPAYVAPPVVYRAPVVVAPAPYYRYPARVYYRW